LLLRIRANEREELDSVKKHLDNAKQETDRLWKEKEHYLRELRANKVYELRSQIEAEHAKVLELTKKNQDILKEKERLLTRLIQC
jgi:vacuolar-type H+-ATPase subunit H